MEKQHLQSHILREPERKKTKSFHGPQSDFKFPSTESLLKNEMDEYHLDNHHLLNDSIPRVNVTTANMHSGSAIDSDTNSQILSDYTSFSNPNSSNGYYSFANISDNTTSRNGPNSYQSYGLFSNDELQETEYRHTLDPEKISSNDTNHNNGYIHSTAGNDTQENNTETKVLGRGISNSISTANHSIPTIENISYRIESATSSLKSSKSVIQTKRLERPSINRVPTITRIGSIASYSSSSLNVGTSSLSLNRKRSNVSSLKRSGAIRCKGGLLYYFTTMGAKFRKQFHKMRMAIKRKLFGYQRSNSIHRSASIKSELNKKAKKSTSIKNRPVTSHLKRTQGYITNLQRSMSYKSLEPVLVPRFTDIMPNATSPMRKISNSQKAANYKKTASLRRTPSSIRRAASVFTSHNNSANATTENLANIVHATEEGPKSPELLHQQNNTIKGKISRSQGHSSLNTIIREPSIVVRNKVIPLSMKHYAIKEEDEEKLSSDEIKEENEENIDEYVIKTEQLEKQISNKHNITNLEPAEEIDNDDSSFDDVDFVSMDNDNEHLLASEIIKKNESEQLQKMLKQYLTHVIAQRIKLRLQLAKFQETGKIERESNSSHYDDKHLSTLVSLISEQESRNRRSQIFEKSRTYLSSETSSEDSIFNHATSDLALPFQYKNTSNDNVYSSDRLSLSIHTDFGESQGKHSTSVLSFHAQDVKRSLTLPISMKV
ncbi:hypothetical protein Kpol_1072p13 [Vanderwaltozyma polyspora DSM 70294]|uniref:Altered inheritance of mitochondria protein 44 n=1 Tax=Vanderwaltozyma polyspora (strain ATCC 22028 / DSM 70294 / BCRC 21397 / CBS 2163 / NBRC 10782 / NRRL Y-8283 / UCD 57-17) TaxID=436907 RepID=AIM44_VANPO|nr:uncharacterized protein Kpol_1072p13 [Vanderwaltozyma polyspora DSM 70294]A7TKN1.1 RecName: Full=Altered inheritance of mitochondria protein 44 [Vanderwaltozyma polyspora DSM 70294]EDO17143.1 hypothetical protein Kpol_1072p13 [Vanderwaltozyma polyspora DSM 70294]